MNTHLTPVQESVSALFRESPFALPGEYHELKVAAGQSIAEIVNLIAKPWQHAYLRVVLNGEVIDATDWPLTVPAKGDALNIVLVPQGSDVGSIFKAIAIIAIVIVATYFAGPAGLGLSSSLAAGVGAAAGLAASLALNAIFPPPAPTMQQLGSSGVAEDPVYGFSKVSNAANPYGCIPRVYGRRKVMPQHAMNPVIISSGTNQYLYQAFTAGYGPLQIEDIRIGDTPIGNYSDVEIHIHESFAAGDPLYLINQDVWQDPFSIKLTHGTVNIIETTDAAQALALDLQFNQGLFWINNDNGDFNAEGVAVQVQVRLKGTDLWSDVGSYSAYSVDGGSLSGSTITVSRKSQRPFFVTVNVTLPAAGKYEVRAVRLTEDRESREKNKSYDTVYIASLRSIRFVPPIAPDKPISLIEIKIKATEQLNGAINNLSCIVTSKLPVYDGSNWNVQATRNPAWCYLDAMRGNAVRRPVKDHRILFGDILEWAAWCDTAMANAPGMARAMCDLEVTGPTSVYETMKLVAATGFATPAMVGNRYSVAIDRERTTPVQIFTSRNCKMVDGAIGYHIQPHALRVQFTPTDSTTADEVVVFDDGYNADGTGGNQVATRYEVMKVVGVSRREQAYVIGRRSLAQGRLRIEQWTIQTDAENLLATRGSYVRWAHDVPMIGSGTGRVVSKVGQVITIDEPVSATGTIYALVRRSDNTQQDYNVGSYTGSTLTLTGNVSAINEGDLLVYGNLNQVTEHCYVKSIHPGPDMTAELVLVPYAAGVYTAEIAPIPAYAPVISWSGGTANGGTSGLGGVSTTPGHVNSLQAGVVVSYIDNAPRLSVNLSWTPPVSGAAAAAYKVYHFTGGVWQLRATVYDTAAVAYSDYQFVDEAGQPVNMNGVAMLFAVSAIGADGSSLPPELASHTSVTPQILGPASVASVSVVGGVFENKLAWQLATNGFDVAYAEIWAAATNDRNQATLIATVKSPANTYNHVGLQPGATWYYWLRLKDAAGNTSTWYPGGADAGIGCAPSTDAAYLLSQLHGAIGLDQVAEEIAQPIGKIDALDFASTWEQSNNQVLKDGLTALKSQASLQASAQVTTEKTERVQDNDALAQQITTVAATAGQALAAVQTEQTARSEGDSALAQQITTVAAGLNDNAAAIQTEATARADADSALSTTISTVQAAATKTRTYRQATAPTTGMITGDLWFDSDDNNKAYRYSGSAWVVTDDTRIATNAAAIQTEATARANADTALSNQITTLVASVGDNAAAIQTEATARASGDSANVNLINQVQARLNTGDYAAVKETVTATASALDGVKAKYLLQVDANGHVSAINLQSGADGGSMVFLADKFMMAKPDGSGASPLLEIGTVNGVNVLGFKGALIGASGTFSGALQAASGTFRGELAAASGTFGGKLLAGTVDLASLVGSSYTFSTPGWQTLYVPDGYTSMRVTMIGGGGGGGSASYGEWNRIKAGGGGGGSGSYVINAWDSLAVGATISIYVGGGGAGATEWAQAGFSGDASYVNYNGTRLITANGGAGGGFAALPGASVGGNGASPANGWGVGGAGQFNAFGLSATGFGAGGAGGGNSGREGAYAGGSPDKYNQWFGGGAGSGGRVIVEFYNQNAVVLRSEFSGVQNRVTALETATASSFANRDALAIGSMTLARYAGNWMQGTGLGGLVSGGLLRVDANIGQQNPTGLGGSWRYLGGYGADPNGGGGWYLFVRVA